MYQSNSTSRAFISLLVFAFMLALIYIFRITSDAFADYGTITSDPGVYANQSRKQSSFAHPSLREVVNKRIGPTSQETYIKFGGGKSKQDFFSKKWATRLGSTNHYYLKPLISNEVVINRYPLQLTSSTRSQAFTIN